ASFHWWWFGSTLSCRWCDLTGFQTTLILGIVLEFLANPELHESGNDNCEQRGGDANEQNLDESEMMCCQHANHRRCRGGYRASCNRLLRRDRGNGHGPFGPDATFVSDFVDHR